MKNYTRRFASLFLAVVMLVSSVMITTTVYAETPSNVSDLSSEEEAEIQYRSRHKIYTVSREELSAPWILYDTKTGTDYIDTMSAIAALDNIEQMTLMFSRNVIHQEIVNKYFYTSHVTGSELTGTFFYATTAEFMAMDALATVGYHSDGKTYYRYTYSVNTVYYTEYYYYKWSDWTEWGDTVYTPGEDTEVETREGYCITYNLNGGDEGPENQVKIVGESLTLSPIAPWRKEYVFLGWATSATGEVEYSVGAVYSVNRSATLYAVWKPIDECETTKTYYRYREKTYTTSTTELDFPWILYDTETKYRHTNFASAIKQTGWSGTLCVHDEIPIYRYVNSNNWADWFYATPSEFMSMGGSTVLSYFPANESYTKYVYCTSREPYSLYYYYMWGEWSDWTEIPISASNNVQVQTKSVELFTISYDANGGVDAPLPQTKMSATDITLSHAIPTRGNDIFLGWAECIDGEVLYQPGDVCSLNSNTTLYAQWDIRYTITFDATGGANAPTAQVKTPGEDITLDHTIPIREFYKFLGWSTTKNGQVEYLPNSSYAAEGNATLYAVWERDVKVVDSGECGDSLIWELYNDGLLVISGTGAMYSYDFYNQPWPTDNVKYVEISEGVSNISAHAFYGCANMVSIILPSTIGSIGEEAFNYCRGLTEITLPANLSMISDEAFANCSNLLTIDIPESVTYIGMRAFQKCENMVSVQLPSKLSYVCEETFYDCSSLIEVVLPSELTTINDQAFAYCESLQSITVSKNLTRIGDEAFYRCTSLETIYYEGSTEQWAAIRKGTNWDYCAGQNTLNDTYVISRKEYTVSYDANGGEGAPSSQTKIQGANLFLADVTPICDGYIFQGWATTPNGTAEYNAGDVYTKNADVVLYAVWRSPYAYTINYDAGGGTGTPPSQTKTEKIAVTLSEATPTRVGYIFDHWEMKTALPSEGLESDHNYESNANQGWTISSPGATSIQLTFDDRTLFESGYDFLYVYDNRGIRTSYTGTELAGETIEVQGDSVRLVLFTDSMVNKWGFAVTSAIACYPYHPGASYTTDANATLYAVWADCVHQWGESIVTVEPTHTTKGQAVSVCVICKASNTEEVIELPDHYYGVWMEYDSIKHSRTCECGDIIYAEHIWNDGVVTTEATHTTMGVKTFTCIDCTATKTEDVDMLSEHIYGNWQKEYGYHKKVCACGDIIKEDHIWNEGIVTKEPTHTTTGIYTYTCTVCRANETMTILKLPHSFGPWVNSDETQHTRICDCGVVETAFHNWDEGTITLPPTQTMCGERTYTCKDCSAIKVEVVYGYVVAYDANGGMNAPATQIKLQNVDLLLSDEQPVREGYIFQHWSTNVTGENQKELSIDGLESAHSYKNNTNQEWVVSSAGATSIKLTFHNSTQFETNYDFLLVYDGNGNLISSYTGYQLGGETIEVQGEKVTLVLTTDESRTWWGFAITSAVANYDSYHSGDVYSLDADMTLYAIWEVCEHDWDEGVMVAPATHISFGEYQYTCQVCFSTKIEQIAKTMEHSYDSWTKVDSNTHQRICACGEVETESHNWGSGIVTTQPTHIAYGERTYVCADCSAIMTEQIAKTTEHTYGSWSVVDDKTHQRTCSCGTSQSEIHTYDNDCDTECNICLATRTTIHQYDHACDTTCNICHAVRPITHVYSHACDASCNVCGIIRIVPNHKYDNEQDTDCNICGAIREIIVVNPGDVNGDDKVNVRDLGLLQQYLNGWSVKLSVDAADVSGDGKVNVRDLGLLQQYLNGWNVELV